MTLVMSRRARIEVSAASRISGMLFSMSRSGYVAAVFSDISERVRSMSPLDSITMRRPAQRIVGGKELIVSGLS